MHRVPVDADGEGRVGVAEQVSDSADIPAGPQGEGGPGVAGRVQGQLPLRGPSQGTANGHPTPTIILMRDRVAFGHRRLKSGLVLLQRKRPRLLESGALSSGGSYMKRSAGSLWSGLAE